MGGPVSINRLRYGGQNYFWISDQNAVIITHPTRPDLNGQDASELRDANGFALFKAFANEVAAHEHGYVRYLWPRPITDCP